jgi:hypothetical protein
MIAGSRGCVQMSGDRPLKHSGERVSVRRVTRAYRRTARVSGAPIENLVGATGALCRSSSLISRILPQPGRRDAHRRHHPQLGRYQDCAVAVCDVGQAPSPHSGVGRRTRAMRKGGPRRLKPALAVLRCLYGAAGGNRTRASCLGSKQATITSQRPVRSILPFSRATWHHAIRRRSRHRMAAPPSRRPRASTA